VTVVIVIPFLCLYNDDMHYISYLVGSSIREPLLDV